MRIATQNVCGMRGEFKRGHGVKISMLRNLIREDADFVILTEVKAKIRDVQKTKIKRNLLPTVLSLHEEAQKGVVIFSNAKHKLIEGSQREATVPGHLAAAVFTCENTRTIVVGFYGESASNDRTSNAMLIELRSTITELQHIYHTQTVIIAGDFNVVTHTKDSTTTNHTAKPRSARTLLTLMEDFNLTDMALASNRPWHTWFRHGTRAHSSRIDLILTSIPPQSPKTSNILHFLDHTFLEATFNVVETQKTYAMKDFILGSDEYLIKSQDIIEDFISKYGTTHESTTTPHTPPPSQNENTPPPPLTDDGKDFFNVKTGHTSLHVFNSLLSHLQTLHNGIGKTRAMKLAEKLQDPSRQLLNLKKQLRRAKNEAERTGIHEQICEIQKTIKDDIEAKSLASHMRISNFYRTNTGKMVPETFQCIKDPKRDRKIQRLEHEGRDVTEPEEIIEIMQNGYESTAACTHPQTLTLDEFLRNHNLQLPQLSAEDCEELEQEFSIDEVKQAISEAKTVSAPGPSGQTITFFKLIFASAPNLMVQALNQLVFVPSLVSDGAFKWIQERKVIYIPKKATPVSPGDYRPLSMLEVLYKIPSRILAKRLTRVLPKLIGPNQHGFMPQKGIQEPSLLATHLIEEANRKNKPLQLVSFDIEKAFDKVSHSVITQALRAFGVPEIMIQAIRQYTLVGFARVEVNGRQGILITIRTGSGQGDPLSSILFLLASEPLNRVLTENHNQIMYTTNEGLKPGPELYADDNLIPLALPSAAHLTPVLNTYKEYEGVSGLKVNINKTAALCINTQADIVEDIQHLGISTPEHIKHLGIHLGKTLDSTINETMSQISPKAIKRRILATTPPTDILHRATLINTAFLPIYNHVFMAIPVNAEHCDLLFEEIKKFLWTRQKNGQTIKKRNRVAAKRISANLSMGGLKIQHPKETVCGFQQNLIQRILLKNTRGIPSLLPELLNGLLTRINRPNLDIHIQQLGPKEWEKTGNKLLLENTMLGQAFLSMSILLKWHETSNESWHCAAIIGHSQLSENGLLRISTPEEVEILRNNDILTVSQLFEEGVTGGLSRQINNNIIEQIPENTGWLALRLKTFAKKIQEKKYPISGKTILNCTSGTLLMRGEKHLSQVHKKIIDFELTEEIKIAPAYNTRIRDQVYRPDPDTFKNAYKILEMPWIPSKTKEIVFEILNRTIWTNNKSFKSQKSPSPNCDRCGEVETMEHLLHDCDYYSAPLWQEFSSVLTQSIQHHHGQGIAQIHLTPREIIFNAHHPSILLYIECDFTRKAIILLIQEIKRSIIHKRMNNNIDVAAPTAMLRIQSHLRSTILKVQSYLQYQNTPNTKAPVAFLNLSMDKLAERIA